MSSFQPQPLGLIGLGLLGSALAARLSGAGHTVCGFDTDSKRVHEFVVAGGRAAGSPDELFANATRVLLCLPNSTIVRKLIEDSLPVFTPGTVILDTTTGAPEDAVHCEQILRPRNVQYLDATVSGSSEQMRVGEAVLMVGGDAEPFAAALDVLSVLGKQVFHTGPVGSGARMKLVTNLVLGLNRAALAEGLALARECGLDLPQTLEILASGAAFSRVMETKGEKMITRDFTPQAKLSQHLKDVRLIEELARTANAQIPLSAVHRELLERAEQAGFGEADNAAVIESFSLD